MHTHTHTLSTYVYDLVVEISIGIGPPRFEWQQWPLAAMNKNSEGTCWIPGPHSYLHYHHHHHSLSNPLKTSPFPPPSLPTAPLRPLQSPPVTKRPHHDPHCLHHYQPPTPPPSEALFSFTTVTNQISISTITITVTSTTTTIQPSQPYEALSTPKSTTDSFHHCHQILPSTTQSSLPSSPSPSPTMATNFPIPLAPKQCKKISPLAIPRNQTENKAEESKRHPWRERGNEGERDSRHAQ